MKTTTELGGALCGPIPTARPRRANVIAGEERRPRRLGAVDPARAMGAPEPGGEDHTT